MKENKYMANILAKSRLDSAVNTYDEYKQLCMQTILNFTEQDLERVKKETERWNLINRHLEAAFKELDFVSFLLREEKKDE